MLPFPMSLTLILRLPSSPPILCALRDLCVDSPLRLSSHLSAVCLGPLLPHHSPLTFPISFLFIHFRTVFPNGRTTTLLESIAYALFSSPRRGVAPVPPVKGKNKCPSNRLNPVLPITHAVATPPSMAAAAACASWMTSPASASATFG